MILPWEGFNGAPKDDPRFVVPDFSNHNLLSIAALCHPVWASLKDSVKCMHARNVPQVLGMDLDVNNYSDMIVCWTPGAKSGGGTGQAIRVAQKVGIPVFDLASDYDCRALVEFVNSTERQAMWDDELDEITAEAIVSSRINQ